MFDFNKLDEYRNFMEKYRILSVEFKDRKEFIVDYSFPIYKLRIFNKNKRVEEIRNKNWNKFKIKVANYFLKEEK